MAANVDEYFVNCPVFMCVVFCVSGCGHCKAMKPAYGEAATTLKNENVGALSVLIRIAPIISITSHTQTSIKMAFCCNLTVTLTLYQQNQTKFTDHVCCLKKRMETIRTP
jgi:hypothetical protein